MAQKNSWKEIWESRVDLPERTNHLGLLKANGYDNSRSSLYPWNLASAQEFYWNIISLQSEDTVYEVGCGSGAFLYPLYIDRHKVGGADLSHSLVSLAKASLPGGEFECAPADQIDTDHKWDHVLAFGLFLYFPDHDYAEKVLDLMLEKSNKSVSVYDIPDAAKEDACEQMRRDTTPNYDQDYSGLKHLYFQKQWFCDYATKRNLHLTVFDQVVPNYENGKYRFCAVFNKKM
jgi:trans-aconitate methyltransferase